MSGSLIPIPNVITDSGLAGFQNFRTIGQPFTQLALYTLSIRAPGLDLLPFLSYTFGLAPQSVRKEFHALSAVYDTAGSPVNLGVTRQIDQFGFTPVSFSIEGTTGWKYHSTDGFTANGMDSMSNLLSLLNEYAALNQEQAEANDPNLYTLEFYDYFRQDFWQVVPVGPQGIYMSSQAPLLQYYRFNLAGIQPVESPILSVLVDPIAALFTEAASFVTSTIQAGISSVLGIY